MVMRSASPTEVTEETPRYYIDLSWFDENGLSFNDIAQARMCEECRAKLGTEVEERTPIFDKKTGRMTFEFKKVRYGSNPIRTIRDHCARRKGYITPEMPTLEAIFRIYLANGNQPMPLEHVREQLTEWCPGGGCQWLMLPTEALERLVQHDTYYGIRRHQLPTAA